MISCRHYVAAACLFAVVLASSGCQHYAEKPDGSKGRNAAAAPILVHREFNDKARFIAGLAPLPDSVLAKASESAAWHSYAESFTKSWTKLDTARMANMRRWASTETQSGESKSNSLFYPFSGPDFLHATTFFPNTSTYVLVGLEPIGSVPEVEKMAPDEMTQYFSQVNRSLQELLSFSFFKTNNMKVDLKQELDGTVPLLMIFLARTDHRIDDIQFFRLDDKGAVLPAPKNPAGVDIAIRTAAGVPKHVVYFSVNLDNPHLKKNPEFMAYVNGLGTLDTYLKSASYLLYKDYFSTIRSSILERSTMILQDDSGIPFKFFTEDKWNVQLYGVYKQPIEMFAVHKDDRLAAAYKGDKKPGPLSFGVGYNWQKGNSNLLIARRIEK